MIMEQTIQQRIADIQRGNVPVGYKTTKCGIIPDTWSCCHPKEIFYGKSIKNNAPELPVLSVTQENGVMLRSEMDKDILYKEDSISSYKRVDIGDFVISLRSFEGGIEYSSCQGVVSPAYTIFSCSENVCGDYFKYYFKSDFFIKKLNTAVYGIRDGKQIGFQDFSNLFIHSPSLEEQRRIAEILGCCDRVLALKKELIAEKKKQKKALMQKLLNPDSGFRLPGFSGEWRKTTLGDLATKKGEYGINAPACEYAPGLPRYIRITDIDEHCKFITSNEAYVKISEYQDFLLKPSDIIFVRTGGSVGKSYAYDSNDGDLVFAGFLIRFNFQSPKADSRFIKQIVSTEEYQRWVNIMSARSGQPGINAEEYASYSFMAPSLQEQQAIADILSAADKEIALLEQELAQQEQKKKSLMQLLLTGTVRV